MGILLLFRPAEHHSSNSHRTAHQLIKQSATSASTSTRFTVHLKLYQARWSVRQNRPRVHSSHGKRDPQRKTIYARLVETTAIAAQPELRALHPYRLRTYRHHRFHSVQACRVLYGVSSKRQMEVYCRSAHSALSGLWSPIFFR